MDVPSLLRLPSGCAFHPRCPQFIGAVCERDVPGLLEAKGARVACHLVNSMPR
jgi:oligopeptide/dipeptide ABC transporter ATP-binding protein